MKKQDPALKYPHPRLLAAFYFGLLSVIGTIIIQAFLTSIGVDQIVPIYEAIILGAVISTGAGALFGESIVHCPKPYKAKTFWLGFLMIMATLPLFVLGLTFLLEENNSHLFLLVKFKELVFMYLIYLASSYLLFGFALAVAAGLAAMYLRGRLVYDISPIKNNLKPKKSKVSVSR